MKDIVLINGYRVGHPVLPTGMGYVAQAIEDAGFDYEVCDVNIQTHEQILELIMGCSPRYIGCGSMSHEVEKNYDLLQSLREVIPGATIVLGGPHALAAQGAVFEECPSVDVIIQGEAEEAIVLLLQGKPIGEIPGVLARDSQDEALPVPLLGIDGIAFPRFARFDMEKYGPTMNIASSRGCVYDCSFCGAPKFLGKKWRAFKAERMIEEFAYWYARGYREFYFSDSLFALDKKRVIAFCEYIAQSGCDDAVFTADGLRADHLTLEILLSLKKAHFKSLTLGVESVNDETLSFLSKRQTFSQIDQAIAIADSLDFDIFIYLIIGTPGETIEDSIKSIEYPKKYKNIAGSIVSKLVPIKGTPYYDYAVEHLLTSDSSACYPKHEAYGTNERFDTNSAVEKAWQALLPSIEGMSAFTATRNKIKKDLMSLGLSQVGVERLNLLARLALNPLGRPLVPMLSRLAQAVNAIRDRRH